jgi:Zn-dependent protease/predicted transcriptional regulator
MRQTIRLGRVAGIRIGLNGGAFVIVLLLAAGLAFGQLPRLDPGRGAVAYVVAGVVAAVLFLASVLLHELAHATVARTNGVEVDAITLWLLGGVAELRGEPRSPGAESGIAVVGPLSSGVLGGVFGVAAVGLSAAGADDLTVGVATYLAVTNVALAVFNLVPAAPLDGGRVLRAAVWRWTGDRERASVAAARAGRVFGFVLIAAGVGQALLLRAGLGGLWWIVLGWFLVQAAAAEEERAKLGRQLHGVRVVDVMSAQPVTADPDTPVARFIDEVAFRHRYSTYPLVDAQGRLTGLVTLNRIRAVPAELRAVRRLADIACPPDEVPVARPDEPVTDLLPRMAGCADGRAVVVDAAGRVVGLVSPSDISRLMAVANLRASQPYPLLGADLNAAPTTTAAARQRPPL